MAKMEWGDKGREQELELAIRGENGQKQLPQPAVDVNNGVGIIVNYPGFALFSDVSGGD